VKTRMSIRVRLRQCIQRCFPRISRISSDKLRKLGKRLFPIALVLIAAYLILSSAFWLLANLGNDFRPSSEFQSGTVTIPGSGTFALTFQERTAVSEQCRGNCATAVFQIDRLMPNEQRLEGVVKVQIPDELKSIIWHNHSYIATSASDDSDQLALKPQYEEVELMLRIVDLLFTPGSSTSIPIPLRNFFAQDPFESREIAVPVEFRLHGQPDMYPGDWYWLESEVYIELPDSLWVHEPAGDFQSVLPMQLFVAAGIEMADKDIVVKQEEDPNGYFSTLDLMIRRDSRTRTYTYGMALLPTLLGLLLWHMLVVSRNRKEQSPGTFMLEAAAVMLAVMPLRAVLVPPDAQGLTRVDLILGFGLVVIVSAVLVKYSMDVWNATE